MCALVPHHLRLNTLHNYPHSGVLLARGPPSTEFGQTTIFSVTTPPITALSPGESAISISDLQGIQTLSIAPSVSTFPFASATHVPSWSLSVATVIPSFTSIWVQSNTIISTVTLLSSKPAAASSTISTSTWTTYDVASSLVSTTTSTPVTTITPVISQFSDSTVTTTSYISILNTETDSFLSGTFTPAPSSTLSIVADSSSSIVSSSTTNDTAPATSTVIASPIPVIPASLTAHNPPFYIGVVLGTIAGIACLCALIAWFIRLRIAARRRRAAQSLKLPWGKPTDRDTWGLESGHGPGSNVDLAAIGAMNLGSLEDLADVQAWSPRGDRDVGEPRRSESYINGTLQNHAVPEHCLLSDDSVRAFASSEGYSTTSLLPHYNIRQLPSHLVDQELAARVSREHESLRSNNHVDRMDSLSRANKDHRTRRDTVNKPRFIGLRGNDLNVPWHLNSGISPRSMVERLRNHGKPLREPPWEEILPRQNSGETNKKNVEPEPWSTSFRSSLVSAFNAVAANLSSATGAPRMNVDGFTSTPPRRSVRKPVRDTFRDKNQVKTEEVSRETSISTMTSTAWTLEETREGAGVVHLFIPDLQGANGETGIQRPHLSGPQLSFGDEDDVVSDGDGITSQQTIDRPQVPLMATERPPPAVIRSDPYCIRRNTREGHPHV